MRTLIFCTMALLCLTLQAASAKACTCPEPTAEMAEETFGFMDYVFEGEIIQLQPKALKRSPLVTVKIKRLYKGELDSEAVFAYNSLPNTCGNPLKIGELVTLGAYDMVASQPRLTHICAQMAIRHHLKNIGGYPK